jgi:hypothetical protein
VRLVHTIVAVLATTSVIGLWLLLSGSLPMPAGAHSRYVRERE